MENARGGPPLPARPSPSLHPWVPCGDRACRAGRLQQRPAPAGHAPRVAARRCPGRPARHAAHAGHVQRRRAQPRWGVSASSWASRAPAVSRSTSAFAATLERQMGLMGVGETGAWEGTPLEGVSPRQLLSDPNTAAVVVTAAIPPGAPEGREFDVFVRALNASSLEGGRLWTTELRIGPPRTFGETTRRLIGEAKGDIFINPFATQGAEDIARQRNRRARARRRHRHRSAPDRGAAAQPIARPSPADREHDQLALPAAGRRSRAHRQGPERPEHRAARAVPLPQPSRAVPPTRAASPDGRVVPGGARPAVRRGA